MRSTSVVGRLRMRSTSPVVGMHEQYICGRLRMRSTSPRIRDPYVGRCGVQIRRSPAFTSSQAAISLVAFCGGPLTVLTGLEAKQVFCRVGELTPLGRYARPGPRPPQPAAATATGFRQ